MDGRGKPIAVQPAATTDRGRSHGAHPGRAVGSSSSGFRFRALGPEASPRVLLIEDDEDQQLLLSRWIRRSLGAASLLQVGSIAEAEQLASGVEVDLVISDLRLPDSPRDETVEAVRRLFPGAPLLVLTGCGDEESAVRALQQGAEDYLSKGEIEPELLRRAAVYAIERHGLKRRLLELAQFDALTGVINRAPFQEEVRQAIRRAFRYEHDLALLFIDLDGFKEINDTWGHDSGDRLLSVVARRIVDSVRASDRVARLGGDEFAVLLERISGQPLQDVVERMLGELREPVELTDGQVRVSASVGITMLGDRDDSLEGMFRRADAAMYQAKTRGRDGYRFFDRKLNQQLRAQRRLVRELRSGLDQGSFSLLYQPVVELASGHFEAHEALARWEHSRRGRLAPAEFMAAAEQEGFARRLGEQVLRQVCVELRRRVDGGPALPVSVNISARHFESPDFVARLDALLAEHRVTASSLQLEITERVLAQDPSHARKVISALAERGIGVVIDDFGTGFFSIAMLRELPVRALKIDRSLISGTPDARPNAVVVGVIVDLARTVGCRVIAEGVETRRQLEGVRALGCDAWQGFLCAPPRTASHWRERPSRPA